MSFIRINNRNNFLISEVPSIHPKSVEYLKYWKRHKKRVIEGFWSIDDIDTKINVDEDFPEGTTSDKWRFMPSNLYFYVNFGIILHKPDDAPKSAPKEKIRPSLRDIEWEFFYNWTEAKGFSGFKDDDNYTCNRDMLMLFKDPYYKVDSTCYKKDGTTLKDYIPARTYLRKLHSANLGIPLWQNMAQDLFLCGPRGTGKSFLTGVGVVQHEIITDGAKEYTERTIKHPAKVEIFVGAAIAAKSSELLQKTQQGMDNLPGAWGENTDEYTPSPLYKQMSGDIKPNNMKSPWTHSYDKKVGGKWIKAGSKSNIKHGTYTIENPEAAAGGRYSTSVVEECGLLPNALAVHGSNTATMMDFPWKFGAGLWIGTGGNVEKIQEFEIMFRDPKGFEALEFDDEWEGTGKIGWFFPAYYAMNEYKDENGNTDVEAATKALVKRREEKKKSKDPSALALEMMNYPIKPSEMFMNAKDNIFPQAELKSHLAEVVSNPHRYENAHYHVELVWDTEGKIKMEYLNSNLLERDYPIKDNKNREGVICLFELPIKDVEGHTVKNRYLQGTDTYDDDESITDSLGSTWVLDSFTERIVAEYTGRRGTDEFYEITRKLNVFYSTEHNYEQNKKGLYSYYNNKNSTHLLCDTPESLRDVADITISKVGNKRKGTTMVTPVRVYGLRLLAKWLIEPAYGEDSDSNILNLHKIESIGLLKELINFNYKRNADRISAMIILMILREDKLKYIETRKNKTIKSLGEDDFFNRNYNIHTKQYSI